MKFRFLALFIGMLAFPLGSLPAQSAKDAPAKSDSADSSWDQIVVLEKGPETKPKSKEEFAAFLLKINTAVAEFVKKYPDDKRVWQAKLLQAQTENILAQFGQAGFQADHATTLLKEIADGKDVPVETKSDAAFMLLRLSLTKDPQNFDQTVAAYEKAHPGDERVDEVKLAYAKKLSAEDPAKGLALVKQLTESKNARVATAAKAMLAASEMIGKPVDLKFTAVDGQEVDLAKMQGKVVLVDFWATWCGPCMQEVPNVVATYQKYHDKGFDIVGISLDQSKEKLLEVTKEKGMTWPQYFDGKGWDNEISRKFGIDSIPRMWLINKKGELVTTEARQDLEGQVEKLMAE